MGKRLTASEETALLADTVRAAHEATQALTAAIKEAHAIGPNLVANFEVIHRREIAQLSNHLTSEANRVSEQLNREVSDAQEHILRALHTAHLDLDPQNGIIVITYPDSTFSSTEPLPYPEYADQEKPS
jgi:F0F1-type ATP synthase membrane subunit b/b'